MSMAHGPAEIEATLDGGPTGIRGMNDRFLRACRLEPVDATPVWFMRQAGRSFAAYRKLRERYGILELAKTPDLCAEVTLMPVRELGVDAAVLFADIMLPLEPMGVGLRIEPEVGPIIDRPIRSAADVAALRPFDPAEVSFTLDAIRLVRRELDGRAGVIGFSGAPFTLACYLIEGRPSRDFAIAKAFMYREPAAWHDLMERLSAMVVAYLRAQVEAGADVVQLFDSWVGGLGPADYADLRPAARPADLRRDRDRADDPFRDRDGGAARADGRRRRRRHRDRPPPVAGRRLATGGLRPRRPGQPRRGAAARRLGGDRGGGPKGARRRRRTSGPHLQPGPRRPARHRPGPAAPARRLRPRGDESEHGCPPRWRHERGTPGASCS